MPACGVCGAGMVHFEKPSRWVCPDAGAHAAIKKMGRRKGGEKSKGGRHGWGKKK